MTQVKSGLVYSRLPELARIFPAEVAQIVKETAQAVRAEAQASMRTPKTGRTYAISSIKRKATKRDVKAGFAKERGQKFVAGYKFHRASAPGEAPAVDTGALVNHISAKMTGKTTAIVSANQEYAAALEFGSPARHLAARPFLRPALRKVRKFFFQSLANLEAKAR